MSKNNTLSKLFIFAVGAAIGSAATWKYFETKYEQRIREESESLREAYLGVPKYEGPNDSDEEAAQVTEEEKQEYINLINETGYVNYSDTNTLRQEKNNVNKPYVILPEEFGECDYRTITLTLYADEVLADDMDNVIDDVDDAVGRDSLDSFGQYEDDTVFVRNDARRSDYEICKDERTYLEVTGMSPHQMED